ncbi:MAG: MBL fold metallo-hydrolase [Candidatus Thorarchaeota archaeon]
MSLTVKMKIIIIALSVTVAAAAIATPTTIVLVNKNNSIHLNLLYNAGIMIEAKGVRIYIDPINLPDNYSELPADAILITHEHGDHYQSTMITMLKKDNTKIVFPEIMDVYISLFDGIGVLPGDEFKVGPIDVSCFYMYTIAPEGYTSSHPRENNYTSYIIDIDGFTIFHAGDSYNIEEYQQLKGLIDVALLPLGPGCQTMTGIDVVNCIDVLDAKYFIPIHYAEGADVSFINTYGSAVENTGCEIIHLSYFESHYF